MLRHKRILFGCIAATCIIVIVVLMLTIKEEEDPQLDSFDYSLYEARIKFSTKVDLNVGSINDRTAAVTKAEQVWEWKFGTDGLEQIRTNEQPYSVFYNPEKKMWLIQGHLEPNSVGGVAITIIGDDGKVYLAMHGK